MNVTYKVWHSVKDTQIVPDGEEDLHKFDIICGCNPHYHTQGVTITHVVHKSFLGDDFGDNIFTVPNQKQDC